MKRYLLPFKAGEPKLKFCMSDEVAMVEDKCRELTGQVRELFEANKALMIRIIAFEAKEQAKVVSDE